MAVDAPTPVPVRPSDAERERVVRALREHSVDGRLSVDTFAGRVERALASRHPAELDELVADLPDQGRLRRTLTGVAGRLSKLAADVEGAWREARTGRLGLPLTAGVDLVIGRSPSCDCVLADSTVSRRHASLRLEDGTWLIRDLGSTNGTRINGWRVIEEVEVRPGDRVSFGDARFRLADPGA